MLEAPALRELLATNGWAAAKREGVAHLQAVMGLLEGGLLHRDCRPHDDRLPSRRQPDKELRTQLRHLANERNRFGYRRLFVVLAGHLGEPHLPALARKASRSASDGDNGALLKPGRRYSSKRFSTRACSLALTTSAQDRGVGRWLQSAATALGLAT